MLRRICRNALFVTLLTSLAAWGTTPIILPHQGRLLNADDTPVNGSVTVTYSIFEVPTGGSPLWTETQQGVQVVDGLFTAQLGVFNPISADVLSPPQAGPGTPVTRYLEVTVSGTVITPRLRLGTTPFAAVSTRLSGDVSTQPGMMSIYNMSGSTTGTIRMKSEPESTTVLVGWDLDGSGVPDAYSILKSKGTGTTSTLAGHSGSTTGTIRMMASADSSKDYYDVDSDNDGIPESSDSRTISSNAIHHNVMSRSGSTTGTIRMMATPDSTTDYRDVDSDDDGIPESSDKRTVSANAVHHNVLSRSGSTTGTIRMMVSPDSASDYLDVDSDNDGMPESSDSRTISSNAIHHNVISRSGSTTGTIRMAASPDSAISSVECDSDNDGVPESSAKIKALIAGTTSVMGGRSGSTTGTIRMMATPDSAVVQSSSDTNNDGIPDNYVLDYCTPDSASNEITVTGTSLGGPVVLKVKEKANRTKCTSSLRFASPTTSSESDVSCDASSARGVLSGMSGSTTGTIRMQAAGDSAHMTLDMDSDGDGVAESELRWKVDGTGPEILMVNNGSDVHALNSNGDVYMSGNLGIAMTPGSHHIDVAGGAYCDGTNWVNASDKNAKENFALVNGQELLNKLAQLAITEWNYKADKDAKHIGPTAQDFKKLFGLGNDDKSISTIDPSGVALAAIQELYSQLLQKNEQLGEQAKVIADMQKRLESVEKKLGQK